MRPNIVDYIESISNPSLFFNTLKDIIPMRNRDGSLVFVSGSVSVVFKVSYKGKTYALKCYLSNKNHESHFKAIDEFRNNNYSDFFINFKYYKDELCLFLSCNSSITVDVLMIEWVDGGNLYDVVTKALHLGKKRVVSDMTTKFIELSVKLLSSGFVHGDIKPENIIYDEHKGKLVFIDYDACYTKFHKKLSNNEVGTVWYQHPNRVSSDYGKIVLDHYSIAIIVVSLLAIEQDHILYHKYNNGSNFLLSPIDIIDNKCSAYDELMDIWKESTDKKYLLEQLSKDEFEIANLYNILKNILDFRTGNSCAALSMIDSDKSLTLLRAYDEHGLIGFLNRKNRVVIDCLYSDSTPFMNGIAGVRVHNESYFIDCRGDRISPLYSAILSIGENVSVVKLGHLYGCVDNVSFRFVISPKFDMLYNFVDDVARVVVNGKYFFINIYEESLFEKKYDYCSDFSEGYAIVYLNGFYNIINKAGENMIFDTKTKLYGVRDGFLIVSYDDNIVKIELSKVFSDKILYFCEKYDEFGA